jgi:cell division protein FtsQ
MKKIIESIKLKYGATKIFLIPGIAVIITFILLSFAQKTHNKMYCRGMAIEIPDEEEFQFISKKDIAEIVTNHGSEPVAGKDISTIRLKQLETRLLQNSFIKEAQAYLNLKSELHLKVSQRVPALRVLNQANEQYYIDNEGKTMPLSPNFTARVPVATTTFYRKDNDSIVRSMNARLFKLSKEMESDPFMKSLCGQIIVDNRYEFSIIPRLGEAEIFIGDTTDLKNKFVKLKSFYKTSLPQAGWGKYASISLQYKNQVIAIANKE